MPLSIFGSHSEQKIYYKLINKWSKHVEIYPQVPVKTVLGYEEINSLDITEKAKEYIFKTEFDYLVCEIGNGNPILAVEFDGICGGHSKDGKYIINEKINFSNKVTRKLKLDTKLDVCQRLNLPIIVISFEESDPIDNENETFTILDAIIANILVKKAAHEEISSNINRISEELSGNNDMNAIENYIFNVEISKEFEINPIVKKTIELNNQIPKLSNSYKFLKDKEGYAGIETSYTYGLSISKNKSLTQIIHSNRLYIRELNCLGCDVSSLLFTLGEYLLVKTAIRKYGTDKDKWLKIIEQSPKVEI